MINLRILILADKQSLEDNPMMLLDSSQFLKPLNSISVDNKDFIVNQTITRLRMLCTRTMLFGLSKYYKVIMTRINSMKDSQNVLDNFVITIEDLSSMDDFLSAETLQDQIEKEDFGKEFKELNDRLTSDSKANNLDQRLTDPDFGTKAKIRFQSKGSKWNSNNGKHIKLEMGNLKEGCT